MIAIHTKYLPATNTKGSRIKAYTRYLNVTIPYPYELNGELCHFKAVRALVSKHKLDWDLSDMRFGDGVNVGDYVFCFADSKVTA